MEHLRHLAYESAEGIAWITLRRGKVNAINPDVVFELRTALDRAEVDDSIRAVILTGEGSFFSFGFDIPELRPYSPEEFTRFLIDFSDLYTRMYLYAKPVVAALNGHAIAGGCMLAIACDRRVMVAGKAKISLNEITFGASVFAGSVEMLKACVGHRNAERMLLRGSMLDAEEAAEIDLVDRVTAADGLLAAAREEAVELGGKDPAAYRSQKGLLRRSVVERMRSAEPASIREFVEIWYSPSTRSQLKKIRIRD